MWRVSVAAHQTWQENYGPKDLARLKKDVPADKLAEFLIDDAVSGGDETTAVGAPANTTVVGRSART